MHATDDAAYLSEMHSDGGRSSDGVLGGVLIIMGAIWLAGGMSFYH
jgi:hypothetical protein